MSLIVLAVLMPGILLTLAGDYYAFFKRREWVGVGLALAGLAYLVVIASSVLRV